MAKIKSYVMETVKRSAISLADYNPRYISDGAKARLKKGLEKFGLASPLTVNRSTMTLISGHQRLSIIDDTEGYPGNDYDIEVAMVELTPEEERALNVQMNNVSMMGDFDYDLLNEIVQEGVDVEDLGFSEADIEFIFSETSAMNDLLQDSEEVAEQKEILGEIKEARQNMADRQKEENSADFYFVVVCESAQEKAELYEKMGVPIYEEFVASDRLKFI